MTIAPPPFDREHADQWHHESEIVWLRNWNQERDRSDEDRPGNEQRITLSGLRATPVPDSAEAEDCYCGNDANVKQTLNNRRPDGQASRLERLTGSDTC